MRGADRRLASNLPTVGMDFYSATRSRRNGLWFPADELSSESAQARFFLQIQALAKYLLDLNQERALRAQAAGACGLKSSGCWPFKRKRCWPGKHYIYFQLPHALNFNQDFESIGSATRNRGIILSLSYQALCHEVASPLAELRPLQRGLDMASQRW